GVTDAGELHQLRAVDGAAAQDDLAGVYALGCAAPVPIVDADRALALEHDPLDERPGDDIEVLSVHHRMQIGAGRRQAASVPDVAVEFRETFLTVTVYVICARVTGLFAGGEERLEQRVRGGGPPPRGGGRRP